MFSKIYWDNHSIVGINDEHTITLDHPEDCVPDKE